MHNESRLMELHKRLAYAMKDLASLKHEQHKADIEREEGFIYEGLIKETELSIATLNSEIAILNGANPLSLDDYQRKAKATDTYPPATRLVALLMGLANESGEALGHYKKYLRGDLAYQDENTLKTALIAEIGDVLWYVAMTCDALGVSLSDVAQGNLDKLADRMARGVIKESGDER